MPVLEAHVTECFQLEMQYLVKILNMFSHLFSCHVDLTIGVAYYIFKSNLIRCADKRNHFVTI